MALPNRIFLDTSVINLIVEYSDVIFDGAYLDENLNNRIYYDLLGIIRIFHYANHNAIEMAVSKTTFNEISATKDNIKRKQLETYCNEISQYFHYLVDDDYTKPSVLAKYTEEYLLERGLDKLIDPNDRRLIVEALFYKCDVFCTRDWRTILSQRKALRDVIPLQILTPLEWCERYHYKIPADYEFKHRSFRR